MKKRVGILTSGGDCPGLNATIRGVAKALYARMGDNVEIVGIANGYSGLINGDYREMNEDDFRGILTLGGTILGTKRTPFKLMRVVEDDNIDKVAAMKKTYKAAKLDCLLCLGGNGTHKTANLLSQEGLNIIGLPKTIDNDLVLTDHTPGFGSAAKYVASTVREICSSSRWMRRKSASSSGSMLPSAEMSMRQPRSRSSVLRVASISSTMAGSSFGLISGTYSCPMGQARAQ